MKKLAIFDVDFTITSKETLMQLFSYCIEENKKNIRYIPRAIFSGLLYVLKIYDEKKVKQSFLKFIENLDEKELNNLAKRFYKKTS